MKKNIFRHLLVILTLLEVLGAKTLEPHQWTQDLGVRNPQGIQEVAFQSVGPQSKNHIWVSHSQFFGDQTFPLGFDNGDLFGYPYAQSVGLSFIMDTIGVSHHGLGYYYSRKGWDREDFLLNVPQANWSIGVQTHLAHYLVTIPQWELLFGAGWQGHRQIFRQPHLRTVEESDSWVGMLQYQFLSIGLVGASQVENFHFGLNFQNSPERNLKFPSWTQWTPAVQVSGVMNEGELDSRYTYGQVLQKVWTDHAFVRLQGAHQFEAAILDFYFDPMHFFSAHLNIIDDAGHFRYGGKFVLGPVEVGYNDIDLFREMSGLHSSVYMKIGLSISTLQSQLYLKPGGVSATSGVIESEEASND